MITARRLLQESRVRVFFLVLLWLVALPILFPVAMIGHLVVQRRMRKRVDEFLCLSCGARLGQEAIRLADERVAAEARERAAKHPGVIWRVVRRLHAICPHCGCEYIYKEKENSLVPKAPDFEAGTTGRV